MKKSDELKLRSADNLQIYGAYLGGNDCGAQDYTKAIQLRGVRIVDAKWLEALAYSHDELLEALEDAISDLFYQVEIRHGAEAASKYPSIVSGRAAIAKARGEV